MNCENMATGIVILYMSLAFLLAYIYYSIIERLSDIERKIDDIKYSSVRS